MILFWLSYLKIIINAEKDSTVEIHINLLFSIYSLRINIFLFLFYNLLNRIFEKYCTCFIALWRFYLDNVH